nr:hypothetical protein [Tanacetum cinerariifolium]
MSSSDSTVTYTSVSSEDVSLWGICFFGMEQPDSPKAAPQSPIQTPPVPQDEDEREPMFIQPHDLDYVPRPMYPEYIPLEDEHVLPVKEQPLPPVVSPTAELPEYVAESDPEEDPKEYEDDETEDDPVDYPMDEGDDDNGDSSRDDVNDEDEDEEDKEEENLAPPDSAIVIPTNELFSHPREQSLSYHHPPLTLLPLELGGSTWLDDIPEIKMPPHKRLCLSTLGSRYEIKESSTARPARDQGIDYGFVSTLDAEARRRRIREVGYGIKDTWVDPAETVPEIAPMTVGKVNTKVTELAKLHEHDTHDLYAILEDAQDKSPEAGVCTRVLAPGTPDTATVAGRIMAPVTRQGSNVPPNNANPNNMTPESVQDMIDQALLRNSTTEDGSHSSHKDNRRNVQTARPCFYVNFIRCQPLNFKGTEGVGEIKKLEIELWNLKVKGNDVPAYTKRFQELTLICTKFIANETEKID